MKQLLTTLAIAATLASCGKGGDTAAPPPKKATPLMAENMDSSGASKGANLCLKCSRRTDADTCPSCGETLKARAPAKAPKTTHAPGTVGKTAVAPMWICPEPKCDVPPFPSKGACLKHGDVQMVEQLYTCAKCSSEEPVPGKCSGCGADLAPTVKR